VQRALQIASVCASSVMAFSTSTTGTVRIKASHSLHLISARSLHKDTCRAFKRTGLRRIDQPQTVDLTGDIR
jgi:hypothetical protein